MITPREHVYAQLAALSLLMIICATLALTLPWS